MVNEVNFRLTMPSTDQNNIINCSNGKTKNCNYYISTGDKKRSAMFKMVSYMMC